VPAVVEQATAGLSLFGDPAAGAQAGAVCQFYPVRPMPVRTGREPRKCAMRSKAITERSCRRRADCSRAPAAFTLVEILIVVVILGILATIVIPQFSNASHQARESTLKDDLRYLRSQVEVYQAQHLDVAPGYPGGSPGATPDQTDFMNQMTMFTAANGATASASSGSIVFGPYLGSMPSNPLNNLSTILIVPNGGTVPAPDGSTGWIYKAQTIEIYANLTGNDSNGTPYIQY
jgi:general secretion pathway protein G